MPRPPKPALSALAVAAAALALSAAVTPAQAAQLCIDPPADGSFVTPITFQTATSTSITVGYQLPFGCYDIPTQLRVLVNGEPRTPFAGSVSGSITTDGLEAATAYGLQYEYLAGDTWKQFGAFKFITRPDGSPTPTPGPTPTPTPTPEPPVSRTFATKGSVLLRTAGLTGTFPISSTLTADAPAGGTGPVSGSIGSATTSGTFLLAGIAPAKTVVSLSGGPLTGSIAAGKVTASATTGIAIGKTTVLGVTLNASASCKSVTDAKVAVSGTVTDGGGRLAGSFVAPKFSGCGTLGTFLGATSAKSAVSFALTPIAAPAATS